ncbi:uncharacterized protein Dvar_64240 [Desulfosarcina variabilis str. Montpellier]
MSTFFCAPTSAFLLTPMLLKNCLTRHARPDKPAPGSTRGHPEHIEKTGLEDMDNLVFTFHAVPNR